MKPIDDPLVTLIDEFSNQLFYEIKILKSCLSRDDYNSALFAVNRSISNAHRLCECLKGELESNDYSDIKKLSDLDKKPYSEMQYEQLIPVMAYLAKHGRTNDLVEAGERFFSLRGMIL